MNNSAKLNKKKYLFILLVALVIFGLFYFFDKQYSENNLKKPVSFGVSYSPNYAKALGLDPKLIYQSIITNLNIKKVRLNANWDEIEPEKDKFDFTSINYFIDQSTKNNIDVTLAIGFKLPRWPECRSPKWLDPKDIELLRYRQLIMIEEVIKHYENNPTIKNWQIENEPLLTFGLCPPPDKHFLEKEIAFVRTLTKKPIIITGSGELSFSKTPIKLSDIFGTTLYRMVYVPILGQFQYPLPSWFYPLKSALLKHFTPNQNQKTIVSELQTEVWTDRFLTSIPINEQVNSFPSSRIKSNIIYAKQTGFDEIYLWGVEWWYYLASNNHPEYLDIVKLMLKDTL